MNFNSWWYIGMGVLSLLFLAFVLYRTKSITSLLIFLIMVGVGYIIEFFIYVLFGSYQYFPKIILHNEYYDSNLGAIASNMLALPVAATFIAAFQLSWVWILGITVFFAGVEWMFLKLDLYKHFWWHIAYTAIGLPFYFKMAKVCYVRMKQPLKPAIHYLLLFSITGGILGTLQTIPIIFFNIRSYQPGWFENPSRDTTAFAALFYIGITLLMIMIIRIKWRRSWLMYVITVTFIFLITISLNTIGIMESYVWWDYLYYMSIHFIGLLIANAVKKRLHMVRPQSEKSR